MPTVAWDEGKSYMISFFKLITGIALDDRCFTNPLITQKNDSELLGVPVAM
jgi:hypothetical protein